MKLLDNYGRIIKDLRLSVTPRCNLHCLYCHPLDWEQSEPPGTLTVEDVRNFLAAMRLLGLESVRFTGGEPLVRKELSQMIEAAREVGVPDIAITTNGMLFKRKAKELVGGVGAHQPLDGCGNTRGLQDHDPGWGREAGLGSHRDGLGTELAPGKNQRRDDPRYERGRGHPAGLTLAG